MPSMHVKGSRQKGANVCSWLQNVPNAEESIGDCGGTKAKIISVSYKTR